MILAADPDDARRLLEEVLARPEFHRGAPGRPRFLEELLDRLLGATGELPPWIGEVVTVGVVLLALVFVLRLVREGGRVGARRGDTETTADDTTPRIVPASELLAAGRAAAQEGRLSEAVALLFRAMLARLVERGLLLPDPSRTNREHLRDLAGRPVEPAFRSALPCFERVRYGGLPPGRDDVTSALAAAAEVFPEERA